MWLRVLALGVVCACGGPSEDWKRRDSKSFSIDAPFPGTVTINANLDSTHSFLDSETEGMSVSVQKLERPLTLEAMGTNITKRATSVERNAEIVVGGIAARDLIFRGNSPGLGPSGVHMRLIIQDGWLYQAVAVFQSGESDAERAARARRFVESFALAPNR